MIHELIIAPGLILSWSMNDRFEICSDIWLQATSPTGVTCAISLYEQSPGTLRQEAFTEWAMGLIRRHLKEKKALRIKELDTEIENQRNMLRRQSLYC